MNKVDELLASYGMTRENWEADPSFVADLITALDDVSAPTEERELDALALTEKAVEDQVYELVLGSLGDLVKAAEQHIKPGMDGYAQLAFAQEVLRR